VVPERRQLRGERQAEQAVDAKRTERRASRQLGTEGERPPGPFGGLPISELAIFAGLVGVIVGFFEAGGLHLRPGHAFQVPALVVGLAVCGLGVLELTAREHLSGFRSHTSLLAAIPTMAVAIAMVAALGARQVRGLVLLVIPLYALLFWILRRRFRRARQARVVARARR
jgi:hypothetical protein